MPLDSIASLEWSPSSLILILTTIIITMNFLEDALLGLSYHPLHDFLHNFNTIVPFRRICFAVIFLVDYDYFNNFPTTTKHTRSGILLVVFIPALSKASCSDSQQKFHQTIVSNMTTPTPEQWSAMTKLVQSFYQKPDAGTCVITLAHSCCCCCCCCCCSCVILEFGVRP